MQTIETIQEEIKRHVVNYIREHTTYELIDQKDIWKTRMIAFLHVEDRHWRQYINKPDYTDYVKNLVDYFEKNYSRIAPKGNSVLVRTRKDYNGTYIDFLSY